MTFKKYRPYLIISSIILLIMVSGIFSGESPEAIRGIVFGSLIGVVVVLTIPIYDIEKWSLLQQSVAHFLVMSVTVLPLVMFSGWYDWSTPSSFLTMIGVYLLSGVVLWTIGYTANYISEKRKAE